MLGFQLKAGMQTVFVLPIFLLVLREERATYLLINRIGRVVHENRAFLIIELAIHSHVSDQIYDPLLAFVLIEAQSG